LPKAPVRQWVLSLPFPLRYRLAYDADLSGEILRLHVRAIFASYRRRAKRKGATTRLHAGAVTFIQRFGDALNLNLHFHTLVLDGVFEATGEARFRALPPPDDAEVERVARRIARGLRRLLERRGLGPHDDPEFADPLASDAPALAALYAASVRGKISEGPHRGQQVLRFGDRVSVDALPGMPKVTPRCAAVAGLSLHANVAIPGRDRARIERLCRYAARPPLATERLERMPDGRLLYRLRHRFRDGTTHVVFEPIDFVAKLAALVPPPRFHMVRYHGLCGAPHITASSRPPRGGAQR